MTTRKTLLNMKSILRTYQTYYEMKYFPTWRQALNTSLWTTNLIQFINIHHVRNYAKNMDKPKHQGKKKVELREDIIAEYFNVNKIKTEMNDVVEYMKETLLENVSLRSQTGAIESIPIEFEGMAYTIQDLAQINRRNPKVISLNFSAFPQTIPTVLEALTSSGMNLSPQQDGTTIFIPIPKVTREHREKLAKSANAAFIKCKTAVKKIEIKFMKKLDFRTAAEDEKISIEQKKLLQEQLTLLADMYIGELEKLKSEKVKELLRDD